MFTGLIEEIGTIRTIGRKSETIQLGIEAPSMHKQLNIGDSVAVVGVCLTVTTIGNVFFTVDVTPQTYRNTNLKHLQSGHRVNLERALLAGNRFGGHIVQGHVDSIGSILSIVREQNAIVFEIMPKANKWSPFVVTKGSVTIDGVSLTVSHVKHSSFKVYVIPHTFKSTLFSYQKKGDIVNIEWDILGKYVNHLLYDDAPSHPENEPNHSSKLTYHFLKKNGFS